VQILFADEDRAGRFQTRDHGRIVVGNVIRVNARSERRPDAFRA
jgi:hypothetical protein